MDKQKASRCDCDAIHRDVIDQAQRSMPTPDDMQALSNLYKMFSDNTRLRILFALRQHEMCVCDLAVLLDMTKSAVSHQLKLLRLANLVTYNKQGRIVYYSLADCHVKDIFEGAFEHVRE